MDDFELFHFGDLTGYPHGYIPTRAVDAPIARLSQAEEIVILRDDLAAGPREIEGERRHVSAQVVNPKHQILVKLRGGAPHRPADAQRRKTEFMPRRVERLDAREAKIPFDIGVEERRDKATAGGIDVDRDVEASFSLQLVERIAHLLDRLELTGKRQTEGGNDADGVLVAALEHLFGVHRDALGFHGNFAELDVPVTSEFMPANLDGAADQIGPVDGLAVGSATVAPAPLERHAAEHRRLARAGRRTARRARGVWGVPQIGQDVHAALFDRRRLRILILVDHVLVDGVDHQLSRLAFHPRRAERRQVLAGVAVEHQLVADQPVGGSRGHLVFRHSELWRFPRQGPRTVDGIEQLASDIIVTFECVQHPSPPCVPGEFELRRRFEGYHRNEARPQGRGHSAVHHIDEGHEPCRSPWISQFSPGPQKALSKRVSCARGPDLLTVEICKRGGLRGGGASSVAF